MKWYYVLAAIAFLFVLYLAYWAILDWDGFIAYFDAINNVLFK